MAADTLKTIFWREEELTLEEEQLFDQLMIAHYQSCFRPNASSMAITLVADASGDLAKAISAGIMTMGERHAPVEETVRFLLLENPELKVESMLDQNQKVPGWGGTFQKNKPDVLWFEVALLIEAYQKTLHQKLEAVTYQLRQHGKLILPNPSAYTACVAIALGVPPRLAPYLFIYGRISGWAEIAAKYLIRKAD